MSAYQMVVLKLLIAMAKFILLSLSNGSTGHSLIDAYEEAQRFIERNGE